MAKRPRYSRWRRLPSGVHRFGERKPADPNLEPQRLTLYLSGTMLDVAEAQATREGVETIQEYCADLLLRALDVERVRGQVADVEARRGPLKGLREIADDPEYLAEWSAQATASEWIEPTMPPSSEPDPQPDFKDAEFETRERPTVAAEAETDRFSPSAEIILRHVGQAGDDETAFLPSLRRGQAVALDEVAELAKALEALEEEYRDASRIDRRLAYALHRLAFEAQVLHTDAWPGTFDDWTVNALRAVQEAVDRILSGQDIRYYPEDLRPENPP